MTAPVSSHDVTAFSPEALHIQCGDESFEVASGDSFVVSGGVEHQASAIETSVVLDVFTPTREDYLPK